VFLHLIKDFLKKLDAVEQRLAVSLDRDEIQTLGLKLRFYFNEINHYQRQMDEVHNRVIEIQDKYGFVPEAERRESAPEKLAAGSKPEKAEDVKTLVTDWIARLEEKGVDPKELLRSAGANVAAAPEKSEAAHAEPEKPALKKVERPVERPSEQPEAKPKEKTAHPVSAISRMGAAGVYRKSLPDQSEDLPALDFTHVETEFTGEIEEEPDIKAMQAEMAAMEKEIGADVVEVTAASEIGMIPDAEPAEEAPESSELPEEALLDAALQMLETEESAIAYAQLEPEPEETAVENEAETAGVADPMIVVMEWAARLAAGNEPAAEIMEEMAGYADEHAAEIVENLVDWIDGAQAAGLEPREAGPAGFCVAYLVKATGRAGTAINILEWALRRNSFGAEPHKLLAGLYFQKGFYPQALVSYRKVREIAGDMDGLMEPWLRCLKEAGDWDALLEETERLPYGENTGLALLRAEALRRKGKAGEAFKMIEKIMQTAGSPDEKASCALSMAKALESKGDIIGATDYYEKCFEIDPANPEAHFELGSLYLKHNAIPLAKNQLMTILRKFPESEWADKARDLMAKEGVL